MTNDTREHRELMEDHSATENSHLLTGRPTANVLQLENLENEIYTCAPGENNTPCYMLLDDKFEVLAFQTCSHMAQVVTQQVAYANQN